MKRFAILISLFLWGYFAYSQAETSDRKGKIAVKLSYYGGNYGNYPGLKAGAEYIYWAKAKTKQGKRKEKYNERQLFVSANIGGYTHKNNSTLLFINAEWGHRRIKKSGFLIEGFLGLGFLRSYYNPPTYTLTTNNTLEEVKGAGQSGLMPSIGFGLGQALYVKKDAPWSYYIRPTLAFQMNYNHTSLIIPAVEVGVSYLIN